MKEDQEVSRDKLMKKLMTENDIPWSSDPSGTIYINFPFCDLWLSWDLNGEKMYFLTHHDIGDHIDENGEPYKMAKEENNFEMYFNKEDILLKFLIEFRDGSFDNWHIPDLEEMREKTNEEHKIWLLKTHPKIAREYYPNWYQSKVDQLLQKELTE